MNFDDRAEKFRLAGLILLLAGAYFVAGKAGHALAMPDGVASPVWPPSGITLAALILGGRRLWPGIWLGAFCIETALGLSVTLSAAIAMGATGQTLAGLALLHHLGARENFLERSLDVFKFAAIAALCCLISSTVGTVSLCAGGIETWPNFLSVWFTWWLGDTAGILLVTPLIVAWLPCLIRKSVEKTSASHSIEMLLCFALLTGTGALVFLLPVANFWHGPPLIFVVTPFLLWAAFRFGQRGATLALLLVSALSIYGATQGTGPFMRDSVHYSLLFLELFLAVTTLITLGIAATVNERLNAENALRELNEELEMRVQGRTADLAAANAQLTIEVAERQKTEKLLRTNEVILRQFVEHAPAAVAMFDQQMCYLTVSRRWMADYKLGDIEIIGRSHYDVFPEISEDWKAVHQRCLAGAVETRDQDPFPRLDGSIEWLRWEVRPWHSAPEQIGGIVMLTEVVTQRKQMAEAVQRSHDELEERVAERTVELEQANQDLQKATRVADAANRAKSEFLSRVSHELRTPLNAIIGFGQLLESHQRDDEERESIDHILRAGHHLLALINDVLDITRIESDRLGFVLEPVNVSQITEETLGLIQHLTAKNGVQIINEVPAQSDWHLMGDEQRLRQVLLNLLSNAVKYNRDGGQVTMSCELHETDSQTCVRLSVRDTGSGLKEDEMARLFTPFERLQAAQLGIEGTGMGLALSKSLIEGMGGTIGVSSVVGEGSTFWLELPQTAASSSIVAPEQTIADASFFSLQGLTPTLLYIEDNLSNLELVRHMLNRKMKVNLLSAMRGKDGLEMARQHRPDLILLDLHLPDIEGDEVLRHLRADSQTRGIPVVILSADATPHQIKRLLQAGAENYLTKPLNLQRLLTVIQESLTHHIQ